MQPQVSLNTQTIPFGKYKGVLVSDVIQDTNYCYWLLKQEWFGKKYAHLKRIIMDYLEQNNGHKKMRSRKVFHNPILYVKATESCLN